MPQGLEIKNDAGSIIIDANYYTMAMLAKGEQTLALEFGSAAGANPSFTDAWKHSTDEAVGGAGVQLVAFRARDNTRPIGVLSYGTGHDAQGNVTSTSVRFFGHSTSAIAPVVDWWSFGNPTSVVTMGMETYDASGNKLFSSNHRPLVIASAVMGGGLAAISGPASDYAICPAFPIGSYRAGVQFVSPNYHWLEVRPTWGFPSTTGFPAPLTYPTARLSASSHPSGYQEGGAPLDMLLVDVTNL